MKKGIFIGLFLLTQICFSSASSAQDTIVKPGKKGYGVPVVQVPPEFPGGNDSLRAFLKRNIVYPVAARVNRLQGKVNIGFTVDKSGKIIDPKVISSPFPDLDYEAIRVVKSMPDWKPGTAGGTPVNVHYILPIDFIAPQQDK